MYECRKRQIPSIPVEGTYDVMSGKINLLKPLVFMCVDID